MIVISIIGVLVSIAVSTYLNYEMKSRIGGSLQTLTTYQKQVEEACNLGTGYAFWGSNGVFVNYPVGSGSYITNLQWVYQPSVSLYKYFIIQFSFPAPGGASR